MRAEQTRAWWAAMTPDERSKMAKDRPDAPEMAATITAAGKAYAETETPEQRTRRGRKAAAALTPEQRSARIRKGWAESRDVEDVRARMRVTFASWPPDVQARALAAMGHDRRRKRAS